MNRLQIIPNEKDLRAQIDLAEKYSLAFEYDDFFYPKVLENETEIDRLVSLYKSTGRNLKNDTLHGAFLDVVIHSTDELMRQVANRRIHQSMDIAERLGVRAVIFHTNLIGNFKSDSYIDGWVDSCSAYYENLAAEYPKRDIYIENMFDTEYEPIKRLASNLKNIDNFGICLDYAHASVFSDNAGEWLEELMPFIRHIHINDNDLVSDSHMALGEGKIDWMDFKSRIEKNGYEGSILFEMNGIEKQKKSLDFYIAQ